MGLPVGSWICREAGLAELLVAVNTSTGIETRERRSWPFQMGRVAAMGLPRGNNENLAISTSRRRRMFRRPLQSLALAPNGTT
jgi:hypothetical protein